MSLDTFLKCYFSRTFRTDVSITQCYELADVVSHDPNNLQALRSRLSLISKEIILLKAILDFMTVSWKNMVLPESEESRKSTEGYIEDPLRRKIEKILKIRNLHHDLGLRLTDLVKLINGADSKVQILTQTSNSLTRKAMADTVNSIDSNFGDLVSAAKADERGAIASEIMNIIFAGSFIMMLIDRFSGNDILGGNGTDGGYGAVLWVPAALMFELEIPYMHFILNMIWMGGLCVAMTKFMGYLLSQTLGAESYTVTSNTKVCLAKLQK
jgi:Ca2+-binding RTX toxin-like protein